MTDLYCEKCGGLRSPTSASLCLPCYKKRAEERAMARAEQRALRPVRQRAAQRKMQTLDPITDAVSKFRHMLTEAYKSGFQDGGRKIQEEVTRALSKM